MSRKKRKAERRKAKQAKARIDAREAKTKVEEEARLKAPMLTLMTGGVFEIGFSCLKHIALLTSRAPAVFSPEYKHFYCRYNDPVCIKLLKLEILTTIASAANVSDIVDELAEYVTDVDTTVARGAVSPAPPI